MGDHAGVKRLQRGELARRTGSNLETVRYYEKVGLLPEPPRTAGGYRTYDTTHERRLRFVLRARELGFSLNEIRELLRLVDERGQPCAEARAVAAAHLDDVRAKIADLKRMERVLKDVVVKCADGALPECPLIETLFRGASNERAGAFIACSRSGLSLLNENAPISSVPDLPASTSTASSVGLATVAQAGSLIGPSGTGMAPGAAPQTD